MKYEQITVLDKMVEELKEQTGDIRRLHHLTTRLVAQLQDAVSFMETMAEHHNGEDEVNDNRDWIRLRAKENLIAEAEIILAGEQRPYKRRCDSCGEVMEQGYCIDGGSEYYCSENCLHTVYTAEEWAEMYDDGNSESYWTQWEDDGGEDEDEDTKRVALEAGIRLHVSGDVEWNGVTYTVDTGATVLDWHVGQQALLQLDEVDVDSNVVAYVDKNYITSK